MTQKQLTILWILGSAVAIVFFAIIAMVVMLFAPPASSAQSVAPTQSVVPLFAKSNLPPMSTSTPTPPFTETPRSNITPTKTPVPSPSPTATPMGDKLTQMANTALQASAASAFYKLTSAKLNAVTATIEYDIKVMDSKDTLVWSFAQLAKDTTPQIFREVPQTMSFEADLVANGVDVYGKTSRVLMMSFLITRSTSDKIGWNNFDPNHFPIVLVSKGDKIFIHPMLSQAWSKYTHP